MAGRESELSRVQQDQILAGEGHKQAQVSSEPGCPLRPVGSSSYLPW